MFSYLWPIGLVVLSNIIYHICAKSVPTEANPFATLTVTYLVGAVCSLLLFFLTRAKSTLAVELSRLSWASVVLGVVIVGLEAGFIYAYQAGWQVSTASIVQSSVLTVALVIVGYFLYQESLTWNKLLGIAICMVGLVVLNLKK